MRISTAFLILLVTQVHAPGDRPIEIEFNGTKEYDGIDLDWELTPWYEPAAPQPKEPEIENV